MMNLNGTDLLSNCLINNNVSLKKSNNNIENNPTTSNINEFKDILSVLSFGEISSKPISNNILASNENYEENDISKMDLEDVLILDIGENDSFFNMISSIVTLLDNDSLDIKDLVNIIKDVDSSDELEDAMSKLLSELNVPIILMDNPILNKDTSSSSDISLEIESIEANDNSAMIYSNENSSLLDINEKNNNIDEIINYLENSSEPLTDKDVTAILSKLNEIYNKDDLNNKLNSNKKKEVTVSLDNFNIDIAHNKAISLNGVEFSEEIQGTSSKILEKITSAIHEKMSNTDLNNKTIEIRLKLYPKHLGELTIDILNHDGKMNIKIFSENPSIKEYISSSMKELVSSLNNKNLAIDDIEVLLTGDTHSSFNNNNSNGSNNSNNSNSSQKLTKLTNYINNNDINDEILNNFESSEMGERNLHVNI